MGTHELHTPSRAMKFNGFSKFREILPSMLFAICYGSVFPVAFLHTSDVVVFLLYAPLGVQQTPKCKAV